LGDYVAAHAANLDLGPPELAHDHRHHGDQSDVARRDEPDRRRRARHDIVVSDRKLDQREQDGGRACSRKNVHSPREGQRRERDDPDQELGREHLAKRGERDTRTEPGKDDLAWPGRGDDRTSAHAGRQQGDRTQ
jgi:hypothetical protein